RRAAIGDSARRRQRRDERIARRGREIGMAVVIEVGDGHPRRRRAHGGAERDEAAQPVVVEQDELAGTGRGDHEIEPGIAAAGGPPVATLVAASNAPVPMPRRTLMLPAVVLVATRSILPSPSRSPEAIDWLPDAIGNGVGAENWLAPWPSSTFTVASPLVTT